MDKHLYGINISQLELLLKNDIISVFKRVEILFPNIDSETIANYLHLCKFPNKNVY